MYLQVIDERILGRNRNNLGDKEIGFATIDLTKYLHQQE